MPGFLRQATASQSRAIGPFIDDADFKSPETGLTISNSDVKLIVNGGAAANKNSGGGTHRAQGVYGFTFDATDTATVGELEVVIVVAGALPVFDKFYVVEEAVFDALFAASAAGYQVPIWAAANSTVNLSGTTIKTATDVETDTADIQSRLPAALTAGGNIKADALAIEGADPSDTINAACDTALTDYDAPTKAELDAGLDALPTAAENADAVWDEALAGHAGAGSAGAALSAASSAGDPWATSLPGAYGAGTAGKIIGDNIDAAISSRLATAGYTAPPSAADIRSAVGLASANLDTQLDGLPTAAENATAVWGAGTRTLTSGANIALAKGTGVTGFNDLSAAQVNAEVDTALADYDGPTNAEMVARTLAAASYATAAAQTTAQGVLDDLNETLEAGTAGVHRFTADALQNAPAGVGSAPTAAEVADAVWDEAIADHIAAGTTANALNNATAAGNPWEATVEGSYTGGDLLRVAAAVAAGKTSIVPGAGETATVTFRNISDSGDMVVASMDGSERQSVTVTP